MTRPATHDDIPAYERKPVEMARIAPSAFMEFPTLAPHLAAVLAEAHALGLVLDADDGTIGRERTTDELDAALASKQRFWDLGEKDYQATLNGDRPKHDYSMRDYCRAEGIEFPAAEAVPA